MALEVLIPTPAPDTVIAKDATFVFDVRTDTTIGLLVIAIRFPRILTSELVYSQDPNDLSLPFEPTYKGSTIQLVTDPGFTRWRISLKRYPGWIGNPEVSVSSVEATAIPGPTGPAGPEGPAGPAGPPGPTGPTGATGSVEWGAMTLDANCLLHYRMNETANLQPTLAGYRTVVSTPALTRYPTGSLDTMPGICGGPRQFLANNDEGIQDNARFFSFQNAQTRGLTSPNNLLIETTLLGAAWTIEAWIFLERSDATGSIIQYSASGESLATNYLLRFSVIGTKLNVFWEGNPASTNYTATSTGDVPLHQWVHVAATGIENVANRDLVFYIGGVASGAFSIVKAAGGTSCALYVGIEEDGGTTNLFYGAMAYLRLSNIARSVPTIVTAAGDPLTITNDANTVVYAAFQEPPNMRDIARYGVHMIERTLINGLDPGTPRDGYGGSGPRVEEKAHYFVDKSTNNAFSAAGPRQFIVDYLQGQNPWTFESWVQPLGFNATNLFSAAAGSSDASTADNQALVIRISADGTLFTEWEGGPSLYNYDYSSSTPIGSVVNDAGAGWRWYLIAVRKRPVGNRNFWFFSGSVDCVTVPGVARSIWTFDGSDSVRVGDFLSKERTDAFSFGAWVRTTSATDMKVISKILSSSSNRGWQLFLLNGNVYVQLINDGPSVNIVQRNSTPTVNDGNWHYVLATWDGNGTSNTGIVIYIDGVAVGTSASGSSLSATTLSNACLTIGSFDMSTTLGVVGDIRHGQVWGRVLTALEVAEAYDSGTPPTLTSTSMAADLQGWWLLDATDGYGYNKVVDHAASPHHGTVFGTAPGQSISGMDFERTDAFSIVAWIQTNITAIGHILGKGVEGTAGQGYSFSLDSSGRPTFRITNAAGQSLERRGNTVITTGGGNQSCVCATYDGSSTITGINIYVNGALQTMTTVTNTLASGSIISVMPITMGKQNNVDRPYTGFILQASVIGKALSLAEVVEANGGLVGQGKTKPNLNAATFASFLRGWWIYDQASVVSNLVIPDQNALSSHDGIVNLWEWVPAASFIDMGNVLSYERTNSFSVTGWFLFRGTGAQRTIIGKTTTTRGWIVTITATGQLRFRLLSTATTNELHIGSTPVGYNDGFLHHFAITYGGTSNPAGVVMYIDGLPVAMTTVTNTLSATIVTTGTLRLGDDNLTATTTSWSGVLAHIATWDKVLSSAEVLETVGSGVPGSFPNLGAVSMVANLDAWWRLDETNSIPTLTDSSGNGLNGTITAIAEYNPPPLPLGTSEYDLFVNGVLLESSQPIPDAVNANIYQSSNYSIDVHLDGQTAGRWDTRLSSVIRPEAELLENYRRGARPTL